ncbi:MAG: aldo/keto reductase [Alphaproteobacteria bacterium]
MLRATVQSSSFPPHVRGRLGLGTVQFGLSYGATNKGGQVQASDAERILRMAGAAGFSVIDTAADYGDSETVLGDRMGAAAFRIVTKLLVFLVRGLRMRILRRPRLYFIAPWNGFAGARYMGFCFTAAAMC